VFALSSVPQVDAAPLETAVVSEEVPVGEDGMQVEIPFVPAGQRQSIPVPEVPMDTIVVVGQRQKKRKRERAPKTVADGDAAAAVEPAEPAEPAETELEPFDYASAPNILDQGQTLLAGQGPGGMQKRRKKHEQAAVQYGDFPAPPRAPADVKSGNRSYTYKK
jgi:exosome complex exonuclease RRP6